MQLPVPVAEVGSSSIANNESGFSLIQIRYTLVTQHRPLESSTQKENQKDTEKPWAIALLRDERRG